MASGNWVHSEWGTPLYRVWGNMRSRCNNPNSQGYKNYGGRGIKVCRRWDAYEQFAADVGPHPGKGWTFDRINNNGDYAPSNVRWATAKTQSRNQRRTKLNLAKVNKIRKIYQQGGLYQYEIAAQFGIARGTVSNIITWKHWQ